MKTKITPTQREISLGDDEFIVSKTDLKGRITYANRIFMGIADYHEDQLLGVQHNIIRHPDMPRGVFRFLWDTLQAGDEFFGYVKNMAANGDHYWVFANITPDRDVNNQLVGYFSVRRKPKPAALDTIIPIYREMQALEQRTDPATAPDTSLGLLQDKLHGQGISYEEFILSL